MTKTVFRAGLVFLGLATVFSFSASAQAISGAVTDPSGAAVAGVVVEASSPALIEQRRVGMTDEAGRYSIVSLQPGTYSVTFTRSGFSTIKRDGIELTTDFTAQVNAQLKIGAVQDTVTVEATAPGVDVQAVAITRVMTTDMMEALPTNRTLNSLLNLVPGGGSGPFGNPAFRGQNDALTTVDGGRVTLMIGAGPGLSTSATSNSAYQEMSFSNGMDSPEMATAGARVNLVPKDGGNQFHGGAFLVYTRGGWTGNNITSQLAALGISAPTKPLSLWDFNPTFGGPILKNKLWFQVTFQNHNEVDNSFNSFANTSPIFSTFVPDKTNLITDPNHAYTGDGRLTWQVSDKDKVSVFLEKIDTDQPRNRLFNFLGLTVQVPSVVDTNTVSRNVTARWSRIQTSRLLFEATFSNYRSVIANDFPGAFAPWSARFNADPSAVRPLPTILAVQDFFTAQAYGAGLVSDLNQSKTSTVSGQASYITGSHSFTAGIQFFRGQYYRPTRSIGDATLVKSFTNTATLSLPGNEIEDLGADIGIYLQDKWKIKRLLVNVGGRFDLLRSHTPSETLPASVWLPSQTYAPTDVIHWNDFSPRIGLTYDLLGKGKTVLRGGIGRFVAGETVNLTGAVNPIRLISTTDSRVWTDLDANGSIYSSSGAVQFNELGPSTNVNFGKTAQTTFYDPKVLNGWGARGYTWNIEGGVSQEVLPHLTVNATAYYRWVGNQTATDNRNVGPTNYVGPFCATAPTDSRLPGGGGYPICGLYDAPLATTQIPPNNFVTFAKNLGSRRGILNVTNGFELNALGRFKNGAFITGGFEYRRLLSDNCDIFVDNPQKLYCRTVTPNLPVFRLSGGYRFKYNIQFAAIYQASKPGAIGSNWAAPIAATNYATVVPGATRFGNGSTSKSFGLFSPVDSYLDLTNRFDFRFSRIFSIKEKYRITPQADFYNLFNSSALTSVNGNFNPSNQHWREPTGILGPRQFRLSAQVNF